MNRYPKIPKYTFDFLWKLKNIHLNSINLLWRTQGRYWLLFLFLFRCASVQAAINCSDVTEIPQNECMTLLAFYNDTNGVNWSDSPGNNWNVTNTPCSDWTGISCSEGGRVTTISRSEKNLNGTLPDLSALTQLQRLELSKNQLGGSIPDLSALNQLQELFLDQNQFTGSIPNVLNTLTQLRWIVLRSNQLTGSIPNLSALTQLQYLYLGKNTFSGTIPSFLTNLTQLQELDLELTQLTGPIPNLSALTELKILDLSKNQLNGDIPLSLTTLSKLQNLLIETNHLTTTCDPGLVAFLDSKSPGWTNQTPGISCLTTTTPIPTPVPTPPTTIPTLTIVKMGTGTGTVTASTGLGNGINCGEDCTENYSIGSFVQLTTAADADSFFSKWSSGCSKEFTITSSTNCTATFLKKSNTPSSPTQPTAFLLKVGVKEGMGSITNGSGGGIDCPSKTCEKTITTGSSVNLTATASPGYYFSKWENSAGICIPDETTQPTTQPTISLTMTQAKTCMANFLSLPKLTVKIEGEGNVKSTRADLTTPGTITGETPTETNCQTGECVQQYNPNTQITLTAEPKPGYYFQEWSDACTGTSPTVTVTMDQAKTCVAKFGIPQWTFMVYLDADNNLEPEGIDDFLEMAQVENNKEVNIVVQFDRVGGYSNSDGDWTSCKRFLVKKGMRPTSANQISDLGECNMGDPNTLKDFINWSTSTYPAHQYALVIWNHGGGWRLAPQQAIYKEVAWDDTNNGDVLYMKEVKQAFNDASTKVNLIGFDACLMGMVEVAYQLKDTGASVLVGSEEVEPGDGWPYDKILADLGTHSNWNPSELGTAIVDRYYESYGNSETQSAVLLNRMNTLAPAISTLADTMRTSWESSYSAVKEAAQKVIDEIKLSVIREHHGTPWPGSHGLAIYFPLSQASGDYNGNHIDFPANTSWEEFLGDFYLKMKGSWIYAARILSQKYYIQEHIDLYDFCEKLVLLTPSIQSMGSGNWSNPTTWGVWSGTTWQTGVRSPLDTDSVVVQKGHTVRVSSSEIKIDSLFNQGSILGQEGKDGQGTSPSNYQHATAGGNVSLNVKNLVFNAIIGKIKAGRGGNDMTHRSFTRQNIEATGGNGGSTEIYAPTIINEGMIGPEQKPSYVDSTDILTSDGGNGGVGSNSQDIIREIIDKKVCNDGSVTGNEVIIVDQMDNNIHYQYNNGNAKGGKGGNITVNGTKLLINKGKIASGYGGDARIWWCPWVATAGTGGQLTVLSNGQLVTTGIIKGGEGRVLMEPDITLFGNDMRIEDAKEIVIFGGDEWKLNLNNLTSGAINATEKITLAVGQNGVIDLRNNTIPIFKAGQEVQIFADTILLDEGRGLKDIINAPNIQTHPSKVLYEVALSSSGEITAEPGAILPIDIKVINVGPTPDLYTLTISDSAGWQLGTLPNTVTIEGLGLAELQFSVILPHEAGAKDTVTVMATSQHDPSVSAKTDIDVVVNSPQVDVSSSSETSETSPTPSFTEGEVKTEGQSTTGEVTNEDSNQVSTTTSQGNPLEEIVQTSQETETKGSTQQPGDVPGSQDPAVESSISQPLQGMAGMGFSETVIGGFPLEVSPPGEVVQTPICPTEGLINWTCNVQGQTIQHLTVGPWGNISNGNLVGTLDNQGWVSNLTIDFKGLLTGGTVTGYVLNQGVITDITFVGAMLQGGTLAGIILNESQVGGTLIDVTFAPNAHLKGGKLQGKIQGDKEAPALLENVRVLKGSVLSGVTLGKGVILEEGVTLE